MGGRRNAFSIQTRHRMYFISAETTEELSAWIEALETNMNALEEVYSCCISLYEYQEIVYKLWSGIWCDYLEERNDLQLFAI